MTPIHLIYPNHLVPCTVAAAECENSNAVTFQSKSVLRTVLIFCHIFVVLVELA